MNNAGDLGSNELGQLEALISHPSFHTLQPLKQAVDVYQRLVRLTIIPVKDQKRLHNVLKDLLFKSYRESPLVSTLDNAITSARYVVAHSEQAGDLSEQLAKDLETLSTLLYHRFLHTVTADDIEESVDLARRLVDATPPSDPRSSHRLNQLATYLYARFKFTGNNDHLNSSINKSEEALASSPSSHAKVVCLHNLAIRLFSRSEQSSNTADLEQVEKLNDEVFAVIDSSHSYRPNLLLNQARAAFARFRRSHFWSELDSAVRLARLAKDSKELGAMAELACHQNLSIFHLQAFQVTKKAADLSLAHRYASAAIEQSKGLKSIQSIVRETLLECHLSAFAHNGGFKQLRDAMDVLEDQIDDMEKDAMRLKKTDQYTNLLALKYEHTGEHVDLIFLCYEALQLVQAEVARTPDPKHKTEYHRKTYSLNFLIGELFRLLLVPEYIDVRDALMTSIHNAFLGYKAEGIPGALTSFLRKLEVMSFRLDVYGKDGTGDKDSIIGSKSSREIKIATIMEQVSSSN
jgi:hypothetical protein